MIQSKVDDFNIQVTKSDNLQYSNYSKQGKNQQYQQIKKHIINTNEAVEHESLQLLQQNSQKNHSLILIGNKNKSYLFIYVVISIIIVLFFSIILPKFHSQEITFIFQQIEKQIFIREDFAYDGSITTVFFVNNQEEKAVLSIQSYLNSVLKFLQNDNQSIRFNQILIGKTIKFKPENLKKINMIKQQINLIIQQPIQIKWIYNRNLLHKFRFIDFLINKVTTQYFFFSTTQYFYQYQNKENYLQSMKYIEQSLMILYTFPEISQLILKLDNKINQIKNSNISFSFSPALHRTVDHHKFIKGYQDVTCLQQRMNEAENRISNYYMAQNQHAIVAEKSFSIFFLQQIENKQSADSTNTKSNKKQFTHNSHNQIQKFSALESISKSLEQIQRKLTKPKQYFQFKKLKQLKQLPICIVIISSKEYSQDTLVKSIFQQNYHNYIILKTKNRSFSNKDSEGIQQSYYYFINQIKNQCKINSLIVFVRSPLLKSALSYLNKNHQTYWSYVSYSKSQKSVQIHSFFYRIYELLDKNDFNYINKIFLQQGSIQIQTLGILQLSAQFIIQVQKNKIMSQKDLAYFSILRDSINEYQRIQYASINRLSQDTPKKFDKYNPESSNDTEEVKQWINRAVQREQLWYLPQNHTIQLLQFIQLDELYNISKYKGISRQVHFCLTVLSYNNNQEDRYLKALKSVIQQKYDNYHIVFIDDNSTDNNMNVTMEYMKSINFPRNKITYVQNLRRNFATYNFINAGFNFCKEDDVQMLMDGDDELIGKYAFHVLNSGYQLFQKQNQQVWVVYSNYKSNFMKLGRSFKLEQNFKYEKRPSLSVFGPIRTWRVKVIYNIPSRNHKKKNGQWLDTVYDDALFFPLLQISTVRRVKFLPAILYQYNKEYGNNDDSSQQKILYRKVIFRYIKTLTPLSPLQTLNFTTKDLALQKQFQDDENVRYKKIDIY